MLKSKVTLTIMFIFLTSLVFAQHQHGKGMMYHMYDSKTEVTVSGTVEEIISEKHPCCGSTMDHFYVKVKTAAETVTVFLGPTDYVNKQITLKKGDAVTIFGSKTKMAAQDIIIAKSIKTKDKVVVLRNDDGTPKWAGQMKYKTK